MGIFEEQQARETLVGQVLDLTGAQLDNILNNVEVDPEKPGYELDPASDKVIADFIGNHPSAMFGNDEPDGQLFLQSIVKMSNDLMTWLLRKNEEFNG